MNFQEKTINVLAVEDEEIAREGLISLIEQRTHNQYHFDYAHTRAMALQKVDQLQDKLDLLLLDLQMDQQPQEELAGVSIARYVVEQYPHIRILVLSSVKDGEVIFRLKQMGIHGYLPKFTRIQEMLRAIDTVLQGGTYFGNEIQQNMLEGASSIVSQMELKNQQAELSSRERIVLKLLANGYSIREISKILGEMDQFEAEGKTVGTMERDARKLREKLQARNVAHLIGRAFKLGFLDEEDVYRVASP